MFFPLAFTGICQGELDEVRDHLPVYENDDTATLAVWVGPPPTHKIWATQSGFPFPVLSNFWPHGDVAQAYGVFNAAAGFPNRGRSSSTVGRRPVRRMKEPGESRDQSLWTDALAALRTERNFSAPVFALYSARSRARSSVVELWFYTPAVGSSIPSAPTREPPRRQLGHRAARV